MTTPDRAADLSGCRGRIAWAESALSDLNGLARQHALVFNQEGAETVGEELVAEARLLASNVVHQLRSSLDNLIWELVIAHDAVPQPPRPAFPIWLVDNAKAKTDLAYRLTDVHPADVAVLRSCQPWTWSEPTDHPLAQLNDLWNADKHRQLAIVVTKPAVMAVAGVADVPAGPLSFEDGRPVIPLLRRAIGCVDAVVEAFAPALQGRPPSIELTERNVWIWAEAFRLRDPEATYLDDYNIVVGLAQDMDLDTAGAQHLTQLLVYVQRLRRLPVPAFGMTHQLAALERRLCLRLAQMTVGPGR